MSDTSGGSRTAKTFVAEGLACLKRQDVDGAIAQFSAAIKLQPKNVGAYRQRGMALVKKREFKKAIADFDQAISLAPTDSTTYYFRGRTWHLSSNTSRAIADYDSAIRLDPNNLKAFQYREAAVTESNRRSAEASETFEAQVPAARRAEELGELVIFEDASVKITRTIAVINGVTYSIRAISSVRVFSTGYGWVRIVFGIFLLLNCWYLHQEIQDKNSAFISLCLGLGSLYWGCAHQRWILGVVTSANEVAALTSNFAYLSLVKSHLESALQRLAETVPHR